MNETFEVETVPGKGRKKTSYNIIYVDVEGNRHVIGHTDRRGAQVTAVIKRFVYGKGSLGGAGGLLTAPVDPWPAREKSPLWAAILANMREDTG